MVTDIRRESQILRVSMYLSLAFSLIAIIWGLLIHSQMVLFDGFFSLVNTLIPLASVLSLKFIQQTDVKRFPFGKGAVEPLTIIIQALVIIMLCLYASIDGILALLSGGRHIEIGLATLYGVVATLGCFASYLYMARSSKTLHSAFIDAEKKQWLLDTFLSFGVLLGFTVGIILSLTGTFTFLLPYLDPFMVAFISLLFIRIPIVRVLRNVKELLNMSPEPQMQQEIEGIVHQVEQGYAFEECFVRLAKVGREIFIEVDFVVGDKTLARTIQDFDAIREELYDRLHMVTYEKWFNVSFTADRKWII